MHDGVCTVASERATHQHTAVENPTQDTAVTYERTQQLANALEQLSRVHTLEATPYTIKQALIHAFAEGGWRHGFRLHPEGHYRDRKDASSTSITLLTSTGRTITVTIAYTDV